MGGDRGTRDPQRLLALLLAGLLLASLFLAACGGDDDDDDGGNGTGDVTPTAAGASATTGGSTATTAGTATAPTGNQTPTAGGQEPTATATVADAPTMTSAVSTPTEVPSGATMTLSVYFLREEKIATAHRQVPETQQVAAAAMQELLKGTNQLEYDSGLDTAIPPGVEYLGTEIVDGVATINLSSAFDDGGGSLAMQARLAQIVYTLTQFPTVQSVVLQLDGQTVEALGGEGLVIDHPLSRADFEDLTPAIFVETPAVGDIVSSPLRVTGTANTFEAVFEAQVLDSTGEVIGEAHVMATSGSGTRGTYDVTIPYENPSGGPIVLIVFEYSAKDGTPTNVVEVPLEVGE
jgi:spore germination protein GerM